MPKNNVELGIVVDSKGASKNLKSFSKSARASINSLSDSVFSLKGAFAGLVAGLGIAKTIDAVTSAASRQDDAINALNTSLITSGEFSRAASQELQAFASSIQQATKFGDELILEQIALAKAFGATNEQAKDVTKAAVELAAATGKSLDEATRQVSKTLGGFAGELGEVNPAIKALTAEQLKAGEAAKILIEQYGGSAAAQLNTFSGALAQTANTFGDLQEEIGFTITRNPVVIKAIGLLNQAFQKLIEITKNNQGAIAGFVGGFVKGVVKTIPPVVRGLSFLVRAFEGVNLAVGSAAIAFAQFGKAALSVDIVNTIVKNLVNVFDLLKIAITTTIETFLGFYSSILDVLSALPGVGDSIAEIKLGLDGFKDSVTETKNEMLDTFGENSIDTAAVIKGLDEIEQKALDSGASITNFSQGLQEGIEIVAKQLDAVSDKIQGVNASELVGPDQKDIANSVGPSLSATILESMKAVGDFLGDKIGDALLVAGDGFISVLNGGFLRSLQSGIGTFANIPSQFAGAADSLIGAIESFPDAIDKVVDRLPEITQKLIDTFTDPKFIDKLTDAIPKIAQAIADAAPTIIGAIFDALPGLIDALGDALVTLIDALPAIFEKIFSKLPAIFESILKKLPAIILSIFDALPKIIKSFADAIPGIMEVFADNIGPIVSALIEGILDAIPEIIFSLVESLILEGGIVRIAVALVKAIGNIIIGAFTGVFRGFTRIFENFGSFLTGTELRFDEDKLNKILGNFITNLGDGFKTFGDTLARPFQPFINAMRTIADTIINAVNKLNSTFGGGSRGFGSGGSDLERAIGGSFALGGTVPNGFPNDTFPANLTSGELVVPRNDVQELKSFLRQQKQPGGGLDLSETNELLAMIAAKSGQNSGGGVITISEDGLSQLLLEFSQRNERTAA